MGVHIHVSGRGVETSDKHTLARGVAFKGSSTSDLVSLPECFSTVQTEDDFKSLVVSLNGYFAIVCQRDSAIFAAVDRARSIPLFYSCFGKEFYISDDANWIRARIGGLERGELEELEFCMTGYVTGSDTLYPDVKQLRAGELLVAKMDCEPVQCHLERYYDFTNTEQHYAPDAEELFKAFDRVLVRCFQRLVRLAGGRTIVIPLSGGWDSRLVAIMLKRMGYSNTVAFTYGRPGNLESEISKQVAESLGIEWHFVPYNNEAWRSWFWSEERISYYAMAHNDVSLPHIQDWPAVWELKRHELIPNDSILVPGHTGDYLAGTTGIPESFFEADHVSATRVADEIYGGHYYLCPFAQEKSFVEEAIRERILMQLDVSGNLTPESAVESYKRWVWRERQAKFIVNSVRAYEFWGYDWWIPLGDFEMRDFWMRVPLEFRIDRGLYIAHIKNLTASIVGTEDTTRLKSDKDAGLNPLKRLVKKTLFVDVARWLYRKCKRAREYENHPMAWYGIMSKDVYRRYYHKGYVSINTYLAPYTIGLIELS